MTWRGRHIYLVGLPGAGKSAIGAELARLLSKNEYHFIDLDSEIEKQTGFTIPELFALENGETTFRRLESELLRSLAEESFDHKPLVIATGGGTPLDPLNRQIMRGSGVVVWIDVTIRQAVKNVLSGILGGKQRPLLYSESIEELTQKLRVLHNERSGYYEQSTLHFALRNRGDSEHTPAELAAELLKALEQMSRHISLRPRFETLVARSTFGDYSISIGSGSAASELVRTAVDRGIRRVVIVTDDTVSSLHSKKLQQQIAKETTRQPFSIHQITIESGEQSKRAQTLFEILNAFDELDLSRKSDLVVTLGGGVVSDLAGFAASIFKRGIPVIHVPTTLMAQVDAAIGGKTGIDFNSTKNLLGSFYPPIRVIVDPIFLKTLEKRELRSGLSEVLKYGLIGNAELWQRLSKSIRRLLRGLDPGYEILIRDSVREKLRYTDDDELERKSGSRELLNFGHTFAHGFESATGFTQLLHGEAVTLGMRAAAWLSMKEGLLSEEEWSEIEVTLGRLPVPSIECTVESVLLAMQRDKKNASGRIRLVLLGRIGEAVVKEDVKPALIKEAIEFVLSVI
jgi:shikimate kinase/3-dehydroquinate synthase